MPHSILFIRCWLFSLLLLMSIHSAQAVELIKWQRLPLAIPLQVGHERVIFVDRNVRIGIPNSIKDKLRVQSTGGTVYLLAHETIPPTRIQLQDAETGVLLLLDIATTTVDVDSKSLEPVQIVASEPVASKYGHTNNPDTSPVKKPETKPHKESPIPVVLTRYAAQNLYAPLRTVEPIQGIRRVNINRALPLNTLLPLLPIKAELLAAWRLENYWVSAVLLKNTSSQLIKLDPRQLQGNFIAATFQHHYLTANGEASDTTVVYLVTRQQGLKESLLPQISQINAQQNLGGSYEK